MKLVFKLLSKKAIKRLQKRMGRSAVKKSLNKNLQKASQVNALLATKIVRDTIKNGDFTRNRPLTIAIKGSAKPLVDDGDLFGAVTSVVVSPTKMFVGILKKDGVFNIAVTLHNGATINVTPAMRGLFFVLSQVSQGKASPSKLKGRAAELYEDFQGWKALKESTKAIVIPARPFMRKAFKSKKMKKLIGDNWKVALQTTFRDTAKG